MRKLRLLFVLIVLLISILGYYYFNPKSYSNTHFNIDTVASPIDYDNDGIDDLKDLLWGARKYVGTRPKYLSKYYDGGYPDDGHGVCTDVIAMGMLEAGYNLMELVNQDRIKKPNLYKDEVIDKNIDFRRVRNLDIYFKNNWTSLTLNIDDISQWQAGDIVTTKNHIAIISDKRNKKGVPFIIHHAFKGQLRYEVNELDTLDVVGHYRVIKP